jgi:hypothetical protein
MSLTRIPSAWAQVERNAPAPRREKHVTRQMQIVKRSTGTSARIADVRKRGVEFQGTTAARKCGAVSWEE